MGKKQFKKRGVLIGVRNLVFAELKSDTITEAVYEEDIHELPGTIEIAITASISDEVLGADDNPTWEILASLDSLDVAMTVASIDKEAEAFLLGLEIDGNGVLLQASNDDAPWVAMGFKSARSDGSEDYIWLYKGKFKPSDITYHTKERGTVNWNTPVINATFGPRDFDQRHLAKLNSADADLGADTLKTFFDAPYVPVVPKPAG